MSRRHPAPRGDRLYAPSRGEPSPVDRSPFPATASILAAVDVTCPACGSRLGRFGWDSERELFSDGSTFRAGYPVPVEDDEGNRVGVFVGGCRCMAPRVKLSLDVLDLLLAEMVKQGKRTARVSADRLALRL